MSVEAWICEGNEPLTVARVPSAPTRVFTHDISEGGCRIRSRSLLNRKLCLKLSLPGNNANHALTLSATAAWSRRNDSTGEYDVGLRFTELSRVSQRNLRQAVMHAEVVARHRQIEVAR